MRVAAIGLLLAIFGVTSRAIWQIAGNGPTPSAGTQQPLQSPANESPDSSIGEKPANITRTDAQPTHADFWSSDETTLSASSTDASGLDSGNRNRLAQPESDSWNAQADELLNELNALEVDLNDPNWQSIRPVNNPVNPLPVKQIEGE